jgi:hypothetical protein
MTELDKAAATQIRNIETKTGLSLASLQQAVAATGLAKHGEKRSWLMQHHGLGYGDANAVVTLAAQAPVLQADDPLALIYTGAKAHLRGLHEHIVAQVDQFGPYEKAPKKSSVSLRRKKQFALLGPATKDLLEVGINHKALTPDTRQPPRLKAMPAGGMCQYTLRLGTLDEVDTQLLAWLRAAYDAAG